MTADDKDIALLCRGRVIQADLIDHTGRRKGVHPMILIDSDDQIDKIKEQLENMKRIVDEFKVVPVSSNNTIAPEWNLKAPARAGLTGFAQCHAVKLYPLSAIIRPTSMKLLESEIDEIEDKVQEYISRCRAKSK